MSKEGRNGERSAEAWSDKDAGFRGGKGKSNGKSKSSNQQKNSYHKYNGKQRSKSNSAGNASRDAGKADSRADNDASWYKLADQIARDAGSFSFNNPLGMVVDNVVSSSDGWRFPGVCALWYAPTIGEADEATSPINLQAKKLISFLRSKVSNRLDFAAADAMMYLTAMDSMYSLYSYCVRLYGLHYAYIGMNRYYPQAVFDALHMDVNAKSDWNGFRTWLNTWAYQLSQVFVPASLDYFKRHMWMNANVYLDAPDPKAQSYIFTPQFVYKWNGSLSAAGTCLVPMLMPSSRDILGNGATLETLMTFCDSMLEELIRDKDVGELSGIILRAFGEANCLKLSTIPEDFAIAPVYNAEVLTQIHNSTIAGDMVIDTTIGAGNSAIITQTVYDTLQVRYDVSTAYNTEYFDHLGKHRILDFETQAPSVDDVFVGSRLQVCGEVDEDGKSARLTVFGTEVLLFADIVTLTATGSTVSRIRSGAMDIASQGFLTLIALASSFRSFPYLYAIQTYPDATHSITLVIGDVTNYTTESADDLRKLHSAATMSLFNIPTVGSSSK